MCSLKEVKVDKLKNTISRVERTNIQLIEKAQKRLDNLTKPQGSLGRLEELAKQIVGITGNENPKMKDKIIFTLAGDHGITEEGVSAFPKEVTAQMVYNFLRGGAGINVLARHIGARVVVADMGVAEKIENLKFNPSATLRVDGELVEPQSQTIKTQNFKDKKINFGTRNFANGPAMTKDEAIRAVETGIELVEEEISQGIDIIGTGDMGIGNTAASSAITASITRSKVGDVTGRGTGLDDEAFANKIEVIGNALSLNQPDPDDPIDVLSKVGGFEIGGLSGIILASAANKIPVVIDGFISTAAALIAYKIEPKVKDYMIAAHCSVERGHRIALNFLGLRPLLDLDMRLGEGSGAALGISIAEAAIKILTEMATFEGAGVSKEG